MLVVAGEAPRFCSDGRLAYVLYHSLLWNSYLAPASGLYSSSFCNLGGLNICLGRAYLGMCPCATACVRASRPVFMKDKDNKKGAEDGKGIITQADTHHLCSPFAWISPATDKSREAVLAVVYRLWDMMPRGLVYDYACGYAITAIAKDLYSCSVVFWTCQILQEQLYGMYLQAMVSWSDPQAVDCFDMS